MSKFTIKHDMLKTDFSLIGIRGINVSCIIYCTTRDNVPGITDHLHKNVSRNKQGGIKLYWKRSGDVDWKGLPMKPPKCDSFVFMPTDTQCDTNKIRYCDDSGEEDAK